MGIRNAVSTTPPPARGAFFEVCALPANGLPASPSDLQHPSILCGGGNTRREYNAAHIESGIDEWLMHSPCLADGIVNPDNKHCRIFAAVQTAHPKPGHGRPLRVIPKLVSSVCAAHSSGGGSSASTIPHPEIQNASRARKLYIQIRSSSGWAAGLSNN